MSDATKTIPHEDADSRTHKMANEEENTTLTTSTEHEPASLMTLPPELRLDILERVVSQDASYNLARSASGERLSELWGRLFLGYSSRFADREELFPWSWNMIFTRVIPLDERYTYQPRVSAILHTSQMLREEGCDVYRRFAKLQIAAYEVEQRDILPKLGQVWWSHAYEMTERGLRWHALEEICEVLEQRF